MTAMEFCLARDKERGEAWSNDYTWLAEGMEEYARLKTEESRALLQECLIAFGGMLDQQNHRQTPITFPDDLIKRIENTVEESK